MNEFDDLKAVVQYRRKNDDTGYYGQWSTMAAFDIKEIAEKYAAKCSKNDPLWEYRVIDVNNEPVEI